MRQSQNLYKYLYQMLTSHLLNGVFIEGQIFPSQRELCLQYNVGITTVRRVIKMLDKQGYIRTSQGQPTIVTYRATKEARASLLVQRRDEIADAYRGLELIMPVLYQEGARHCKDPELRFLREILDQVSEERELPELYRQANAFFATLLRPLKNQLIMDLELDSENFLYVPYLPFPGVDDPVKLSAHKVKTWFKVAIEQIEQQQFDAFYMGVLHFYRKSGKRVDDYLCALSKCISASPRTNEDVRWFRIKGRSELYARLAMTIIRRIMRGEFDDTKYLPSIPKLMEEYGVMKDTASRAVNLLNSLGFAQTIDKKGTVIAPAHTTLIKGGINLKEPVIQERLSLFLDALQIVSLSARSCAASFSFVQDDLALSMESRLLTAPENKISPLSFQLLMNSFIQLMPYRSLKNIFQQLDDLLIWGHYMQTVDESLYPDCSAIKWMGGGVTWDVVAALKKHDTDDLADAFDRAFTQIYQDVCGVISRMPPDVCKDISRISNESNVP